MARLITLKIDGMACDNCAMAIEESLEKVKGVYKAQVDFINKEAYIETNGKTKSNSLIHAVENSGYHASVA